MDEPRFHVQLVGWYNLLVGALGVAGSLTGMVLVSVFREELDRAMRVPSDELVPIASIVGGFALFILLSIAFTSAAELVAGIGLLRFRPWGRVLGVIVSALKLPLFPFGTVIGGLSLYVLLNNDAAPCFET